VWLACAAQEAAAQRLVIALGYALRSGSGAPPPAPAVGCALAAAIARGWPATAARLLRLRGACAAASAALAAAPGAVRGRTLLHAAAGSGSAAIVALLLAQRDAAVVGAPDSADAGGITPRGIAAARGDAGVQAALDAAGKATQRRTPLEAATMARMRQRRCSALLRQRRRLRTQAQAQPGRT
jgi:hypothetical protein